ncbi:hypothetical protein ACHAXH_003882 [Discostella pseudostelligera]
MKVSTTFLLVVSASCASAFVPSTKAPTSSQLGVATKGKVGPFRKAIATITKDNFSTTLAEIEPFLNTEAGTSIYTKSMRRISSKAKEFGVEMPATFAKDAKCMEKRRVKQNAYCEAKAEEAAAAAAAEAEAKAEAEAAAAAAEAAAKAKAEAAAAAAEDAAASAEGEDVAPVVEAVAEGAVEATAEPAMAE